MKVAELYASLGIEVDRPEWKQARKNLDRFVADTEKKVTGLRARLGKSFAGLGSLLTGKLGLAAGAAGLTAGISGVVKDALTFDDALTQIGIDSGGAVGSLEEFRAKVLAVSKEVGVAKEEILKGAAEFIQLTGNGSAAAQMLELFAKAAETTGADMKDIAGSAAAMSLNLGVSAQDMFQAFNILQAGGKMGSVTLAELSRELAVLGGAAQDFAGSQGLEGVASLNALLQITNQRFNDAAQARTALIAFLRELQQKASKLGKAGIAVFNVGPNGEKRLRPILDIIEDISNSDLARDPALMLKIFGSEAAAAAQQLSKNSRELREMARETRHATDLVDDWETKNSSASNKVADAWNRVKVRIQEALTPERIEKFADVVVDLIGKVETLVGAINDLLEGIKDILTLDFSVTEEEREETARKFGERFTDEELDALPGPFGEEVRQRVRAQREAALEEARRRMGDVRRQVVEFLNAHVPRQPTVPTLEPSVNNSRSTTVRTGDVHITVNGGSEPAAGLVDRLRDMVRRELDRQARDIAAATGR